MMNTKQILKKRIQNIELQIKKLDLHASSSDVCDSLYNSLILQKAILKKELEETSKNPLLESFKKLIPHKEKLICDYFN